MRYNGKIENLNKIVISDPTYDEKVECRYEKNNLNEKNWNIDIDIHDTKDNFDDFIFTGKEFYLLMCKDKKIAELMQDGTICHLRGVKVNEIQIGVDTACVALGINENAEDIIDSREEWQPDCSLRTLEDGYFGVVKEGKIGDNVAFIFINGYFSDDTGYSKQDIIDYLEYQLKIKDLKLDKDKEFNLKQENILEKITDILIKFKNSCYSDENLENYFKEDRRYGNIQFAESYLAGIELRNLQRKNGKLSGEIENSPYTKEQEEMIDEYSKLQKEYENNDRDYENEIGD